MAFQYTRSSDGDNADNGSTWALAKLTLAGASGGLSVGAAGDVYAVDSAHVETSASATTLTIPSSASTTTVLVSVASAGDPAPPTTTTPGASVETTGNAVLSVIVGVVSGAARVIGMQFAAGDSTGTARLEMSCTARAKMILERCVLWARANSTSARVHLQNGTGSAAGFFLRDTEVRFANASSTLRVSGAQLVWDGGGLHASTVGPNTLLDSGFNIPHQVRCSGLDLSAGATGMNLVAATGVNTSWDAIFRRCRMPTGWTGRPSASGTLGQSRIEMHDCPVGTGLIHTWIVAFEGEVVDEQTIAVGDMSYKMTTAATGSPDCPLRGREFALEVAGGASVTIEMDVITDAVTLTNREFWIEVGYKDASGDWQSASSEISDVLGTPTNLTSSTAAWTTTGLTTPTKQKVSVTFTPGDAQFVSVTPFLGKTSTTVYVDEPVEA